MSYAQPGARGRGVRRTLGILCAGLLALALSAAPAVADADKPPPDESLPTEPVPGGFRSWAELLETQEWLNVGAERLTAAGERELGFTGITAAPEDGRLRLFWLGTPPDQVTRLVEEIRRDGVPVDVLPARHTLAELLEQQAAIAAESGVNVVAPQVDGSGLTVGYQGSEGEARALPAIRAATVPVTVEPFDRTQPAGCTGRQDDCSWYWGGARYATSGGGCSTGFTLMFTAFVLPQPPPWYRMLSAGHCAANNAAVTDGGGEAMGTITGDSDAADLLMISPGGSVSFGPRVYRGPWNSSPLSNKLVKGAKASFAGNWVCSTGSFTGEHCSVKVEAVNVVIWSTVKTVRAKHIQGGVAVGKGDSGGPVVVHQRWGGGVYAMGTISALSNIVACPSGSPSPQCGSTLYYVDIMTALAHYKPLFGSVSVRTG